MHFVYIRDTRHVLLATWTNTPTQQRPNIHFGCFHPRFPRTIERSYTYIHAPVDVRTLSPTIMTRWSQNWIILIRSSYSSHHFISFMIFWQGWDKWCWVYTYLSKHVRWNVWSHIGNLRPVSPSVIVCEEERDTWEGNRGRKYISPPLKDVDMFPFQFMLNKVRNVQA